MTPLEEVAVSRFGQRLEKTGAREVALVMQAALWTYIGLFFIFARSTTVENYGSILIALITNVFVFTLGAFALKTYGAVQEQKNDTEVARIVKRLPPDPEEVPGAG